MALVLHCISFLFLLYSVSEEIMCKIKICVMKIKMSVKKSLLKFS